MRTALSSIIQDFFCSLIFQKRALLCLLSLSVACWSSTKNIAAKAAQPMDGFFAYCTSNLDGTGSCINEEDKREFTCVIVPGAIISCPAHKSNRTVDCVWTSDIYANQAQFWCDKESEEAMYTSTSIDEAPTVKPSTSTPAQPSKTIPQSDLIETFDAAF